MPIIVKQEKSYIDAPDGVHLAVCVDVIDAMDFKTAFGVKSRCRLVWEIEELMTQGEQAGKPYLSMKFYTPSLNEKATLYKDLISWRGKPFTDAELKSFDLENVLGKCCQLVISEYLDGKGTKRTKVSTILKAKPNQVLAPSGGYVRYQDRPTRDQQEAGAQAHAEPAPEMLDDESSIPF